MVCLVGQMRVGVVEMIEQKAVVVGLVVEMIEQQPLMVGLVVEMIE